METNTYPSDYINAILHVSQLGMQDFILKSQVKIIQSSPEIAEAILIKLIQDHYTIRDLSEKLENKEKELNTWMDCIIDIKDDLGLKEPWKFIVLCGWPFRGS